MRRNLNKIVSLAIGISVLNGSIMPVFAADSTQSTYTSNIQTQVNQKSVLTLDDVIKAAISNSGKLGLKQKELQMYKDKADLQDKKDDFYGDNNLNTGNDTVDNFAHDKLELQQNQTEQSEDFLQDQIANDITKKYNAIVLKQMDINKLKTSLEIKTNDLNTLKTKVNIGLATSNQLEDKQIEINKAKDDIKAKEDSLKNNLDYLGVLTDLNLSGYTLDTTTNYNVFKIDGSVDEYLDNRIDEYLKYNDKIIKLTDDYMHEARDENMNELSYYVSKAEKLKPNEAEYADTVDATGNTVTHKTDYYIAYASYVQQYLSAFNNYQSYLEGRYSLAEAKVKLDDSKKSLKNVLKENYSTLCDLENQITTSKQDINSTNTKLKYAKTQVDIGTMTENDYKAQVLKSEDLDNSLRNLINTYNTLKNSIEKPWVLSSN